MIDWNKVKSNIEEILIGGNHTDAGKALEIKNYVQALIAKEFKLVASGKVRRNTLLKNNDIYVILSHLKGEDKQ